MLSLIQANHSLELNIYLQQVCCPFSHSSQGNKQLNKSVSHCSNLLQEQCYHPWRHSGQLHIICTRRWRIQPVRSWSGIIIQNKTDIKSVRFKFHGKRLCSEIFGEPGTETGPSVGRIDLECLSRSLWMTNSCTNRSHACVQLLALCGIGNMPCKAFFIYCKWREWKQLSLQ